MVDQNKSSLGRSSRNQIPGAEFVAAGVVAGAITFGIPPGIGAIFGDANSVVLDLSCDETLHFISDDEFHQQSNYDEGDMMPGIVELERGLNQLSAKNESVQQHLGTLISTASIPKSWHRDNVQPPSQECRQFSLLLLERLHARYGIIPSKVAVMKEGGLLSLYKSSSGNTLRVEIDEDLDAVAVVSDGDDVLFSAFLEGDDLEEAAINVFKNEEMVATFVS